MPSSSWYLVASNERASFNLKICSWIQPLCLCRDTSAVCSWSLYHSYTPSQNRAGDKPGVLHRGHRLLSLMRTLLTLSRPVRSSPGLDYLKHPRCSSEPQTTTFDSDVTLSKERMEVGHECVKIINNNINYNQSENLGVIISFNSNKAFPVGLLWLIF